MKNERSKNILLGILIVGLVSMTVAYAALQTQLKIGNNDTQVTAKGGTWGVQFEEGLDDGWVNASSKSTFDNGNGIVISGTKISGLAVQFGDTNGYIETSFTIHNTGSLDAKIDSITDLTNLHADCSYVTANPNSPTDDHLFPTYSDSDVCDEVGITFTYLNTPTGATSQTTSNIQVNHSPAQGDILPAGSSVRVKIRINGYNTLPSADMHITFADVTILYVQN